MRVPGLAFVCCVMAACGGGNSSSPQPGTLGGPCRADGSCNAGLTCSTEQLCVKPAEPPQGDPTVAIVHPPPGTVAVDPAITVAVEFTADRGARRLTFSANGATFSELTDAGLLGGKAASAEITFSPASAANFHVVAEIEDTSGMTAQAEIDLRRDFGPPLVGILAPRAYAAVGDPVDVQVEVFDDNAPAAVSILLGETEVCALAAPPYRCEVATTGRAGLVQLRAVATDLAGNTAETSVTVNLASESESRALPGFGTWGAAYPAYASDLYPSLDVSGLPRVAVFEPALRFGALASSGPQFRLPEVFVRIGTSGEASQALLGRGDEYDVVYAPMEGGIAAITLDTMGQPIEEELLTSLVPYQLWAQRDPVADELHVVALVDRGGLVEVVRGSSGVTTNVLCYPGDSRCAFQSSPLEPVLSARGGEIHGLIFDANARIYHVVDLRTGASWPTSLGDEAWIQALHGSAVLAATDAGEAVVDDPVAGTRTILATGLPVRDGSIVYSPRGRFSDEGDLAMALAKDGTLYVVTRRAGVAAQQQLDTGHAGVSVEAVAMDSAGDVHAILSEYPSWWEPRGVTVFYARVSGGTIQVSAVDRQRFAAYADSAVGTDGALYSASVDEVGEYEENLILRRYAGDGSSSSWEAAFDLLPAGNQRLFNASLAVDGSGTLHLAVMLSAGSATSLSGLYYVSVPAGASVPAHVEQVKNIYTATPQGYFPMLVADDAGVRGITVRHDNMVHYYERGSGTWAEYHSVEGRPMVGSLFPSAVDATGTTWVLMADKTGDVLKLWLYSKAAGVTDAFTTHELVSFKNWGNLVFYDLAIDATGAAHVAYFNNEAQQIEHLRLKDGTFTVEPVAPSSGCAPTDGGCIYKPIAVAVDEAGKAYVTWWNDTNTIALSGTATRLATDAAGTWVTYVVPNAHFTNSRLRVMPRGGGEAVVVGRALFNDEASRGLLWARVKP